jgi:thiamine-phosphate pyrophosphorylase
MSEIVSISPTLWSVYVITDRRLSGGRGHEYVASEAYSGGADVVQLRDKDLTAKEFLSIAERMREVAGSFGRVFIVNDRIDIAIASSAHGVHIGYDDFPYSSARIIYPKPRIIGVSAGNLEELREANEPDIDYIGIGPIFETKDAKLDAGTPVGLNFIENARSATEIPLIAIGGINHNNVRSVIQAGASAVAVISAVVSAEDIADSTRRLRDVVENEKAATRF